MPDPATLRSDLQTQHRLKGFSTHIYTDSRLRSKQLSMDRRRLSNMPRGFDIEERPSRGQYTSFRSSMSIPTMPSNLRYDSNINSLKQPSQLLSRDTNPLQDRAGQSATTWPVLRDRGDKARVDPSQSRVGSTSCQGITLSPLLCDLLLLPGPNSASSKEAPLSPQATPLRKWIFSHPEPCGRAELRLPETRFLEELLPLPGSPSHRFALREIHMAMSRDRSVSISQMDHSDGLPVLRCRRWSTITSLQTTTNSTTSTTAGTSR